MGGEPYVEVIDSDLGLKIDCHLISCGKASHSCLTVANIAVPELMCSAVEVVFYFCRCTIFVFFVFFGFFNVF